MDKQTRNIVIAGVSGLALGATLGILFAPDEGKKTRAKIKSKASDLMDRLSDKVEDSEDLFADLKDKLCSSISEEKADLKKELLEQIEALEASIKNAK